MPPFHFKNFSLNHDNSSMKVGTDGVLLGAWANVTSCNQILDIGTGSGLIALMVAQRTNGKATIDAIDIHEASVNEATANFNNSPWSASLNAFHIAAQNLHIDDKYDLIVSNPPFFINAQKAPSKSRSDARHTDTLSQEALLESVLTLLAPKGRFAVIWPTAEGELFAALAMAYGMYLNKITEVLPTPQKSTERLLMEFSFQQSEISSDQLVIELEKRHNYSDEYKNLTKDFYLYF